MDRHVDFQNPSDELTLPSNLTDGADDKSADSSAYAINPMTAGAIALTAISLSACGGGSGGHGCRGRFRVRHGAQKHSVQSGMD